RAIHPVTVRVGGFSALPAQADLDALATGLETALRGAQATLALVESIPAPVFERDVPLLALRHPTEYPMNDGRIVSSDGLDLDTRHWDDAFREEQVAWSHALQARSNEGDAYLLGPTARIALAGATLHPIAAHA